MAPFKKNPNFIARERKFGAAALKAARASHRDPVELEVPAPVPGNANATNRVTLPPCLAELQGVMAMEYVANATDPAFAGEAKALQRAPVFRKAFYQRCVYRGRDASASAERPIELTGPEPDFLLMSREEQDALVNESRKARISDVEKQFYRRASNLLKSDTLKQDCRATMNALFDYNATQGRLYGREADPPINADVDQLLGQHEDRSDQRKNGRAAQIVKRCLLPQPRDEGSGSGKRKRKAPEEVEARPIEIRAGMSPKEFQRWMATQGKPLRGRSKKR